MLKTPAILPPTYINPESIAIPTSVNFSKPRKTPEPNTFKVPTAPPYNSSIRSLLALSTICSKRPSFLLNIFFSLGNFFLKFPNTSLTELDSFSLVLGEYVSNESNPPISPSKDSINSLLSTESVSGVSNSELSLDNFKFKFS